MELCLQCQLYLNDCTIDYTVSQIDGTPNGPNCDQK
jgi:hypothetical protein